MCASKFDEANTTTLPKNCGSSPNFEVCAADRKIVNPTASTSTNRLNGTTYDAAGNVIEDAEGHTFIYDAENKQIEAKNSSNVTIGNYYFDGDGKRVKKVVPDTGETTVFVYDSGGKMVAEYSTIVQPSQDAKTQYLTNDHLGTPRINTDSTGQIVSRSDYMPYGEEITTGRSSGQGYVVDDVRQGFTGYENDNETGLDYAVARMYSISTGRFTGVDGGAFTPADPQNFNRYVYVQNNPIKFVDPTGRDLELKGEDAEYIKSELEKFTGYKLILKKGKITIDTSVERKEKGTSKSFAELISKITDKDFKGNVVVNLTSKSGDNDKIFVDKFSDRKLDVGDYKVVQAGANELAGALLSHVIKEYAVAAFEVGTNPFPEMFSDEEYSYKTSHGEATKFEAQVLSELTGKDQGPRREQSREPSSSTKQTFIFKSIEYDIQRKSSQGKAGFNIVSGVVSRPK